MTNSKSAFIPAILAQGAGTPSWSLFGILLGTLNRLFNPDTVQLDLIEVHQASKQAIVDIVQVVDVDDSV